MDVEVEVVWELQETWWLRLLCRGVWPISACTLQGVVWYSAENIELLWDKAALKEKLKEREERWLPAFHP